MDSGRLEAGRCTEKRKLANAPNCYLISDLGFVKARTKGVGLFWEGVRTRPEGLERGLWAPGRPLGPCRAAPLRLPRCPLRPTRAVVASQSTEALQRSVEVLGGSRQAIAARLWLSLLS